MTLTRCAAVLLVHALVLIAVTAMQHGANPRGWQAARQAELQRTQAAPAAAVVAASEAALSPAVAPPMQKAAAEAFLLVGDVHQQACSFTDMPACPGPQPTAWAQLASGAVAFLAGMAAGMLLLHFLQQQRQRRRRHGRLAVGSQTDALSEVAAGAAAEEKGQQQHVAVERLELAGMEQEGKAAAEEGGGSNQANSERQASAGTPVEGSAEGAAAEDIRESPEAAAAEPPTEAAVAAAVQEIVLQQSSSSRASSAPAAIDAAVIGAATSAAAAREQQEGQQQEQEQQDQHWPLAPMIGGGTAGPAGGGGQALVVLRAEEQTDIQAAAQLVLTMCCSMHIDPAQLDRGERLQLIYTMLHAWQAQQGRRHTQEMSRLGSEANVLRSQQRDIAQQQAAQRAARDAYRLSLERTADFRHRCSDTLTFGLVVMVAAGTYQLLSRGLLSSITSSCGSLAAVVGGRRWGLWAAWRAGEALSCYAFSIGDALLGLAMLLAAPWMVYRSGLLSDYHTMPFTKLFVGLGVICGLAGYLAVGKLGGSRNVWLATWEAWVVLHVVSSAAAHRMQRIRLRAEHGGHDAGGMYEEGSSWLPGIMWVVLGLVLPLAAGTLPFQM